jgi:hypothetical protein
MLTGQLFDGVHVFISFHLHNDPFFNKGSVKDGNFFLFPTFCLTS